MRRSLRFSIGNLRNPESWKPHKRDLSGEKERNVGMAVYDKAYELARELKQSPEYKEYQKAKREIEGNESALSLLKQYRRQQLMLQGAAVTGTEPDEDLKAEFAKTQELVSMHGPIQRFLQAEERVLVMIADIQRILNDALNMLDYM